ncbi:MAG: hypothetical protein FWF51_11155 [Chitinivibrionia bacterium]|nr:hypothetical protein [Chitinivibrionia bacterium]
MKTKNLLFVLAATLAPFGIAYCELTENEKRWVDSLNKANSIRWQFPDNYRGLESASLDNIIDTLKKRQEMRNLVKGEYETTADFNKRESETKAKHEQYLKDSSKTIFESVAINAYKDIVTFLDSNVKIVFGAYDADKGELNLSVNISKYNGDNIPATMKIAPAVAQELKASNNIRHTYDYFFVSGYNFQFKNFKIGIKGKNEMYDVLLPRCDNITDNSAFRGSQLWEDNPYAKDLILTYKELTQLYKKSAGDETKKIEEWKKRINVANEKSTIIFKSPDGDIKFEIGKPAPKYEETYNIQGKDVYFMTIDFGEYPFISCRMGGLNDLLNWSISETGTVKSVSMTVINKERLLEKGYGIFDIQ